MEFKAAILTLLLSSFVWYSKSQNTDVCVTPKNENGNCVNIYNCQPILSVLSQGNVDAEMKQMLRRYLCGYDTNGQPKVCCSPKPILEEESDHPNLHLLPTECGEATPLDRITNGEKANLYEFPWQVALKYESKKPIPFHCGGSLINKRYVLTAAHCITSRLKLIGARVGEYDFATEQDCVKLFNKMICAPPVQDFEVTTKDAVVHSKYGSNFINDIALIRLPRDVEINDAVGPVCLPLNENLTPKVLRNLTVVGWGNTEKGSASTVLLRVAVPYQEKAACNEAVKKYTQIQDTQLCAGGTEGKDSCNGDSGGPIMTSINDQGTIRTVQVGLVSFGHTECGKEKFPGIYTRLTSYIDWILDNIKE